MSIYALLDSIRFIIYVRTYRLCLITKTGRYHRLNGNQEQLQCDQHLVLIHQIHLEK
jgi:hypothetical protein